jgi:hypothetical protein
VDVYPCPACGGVAEAPTGCRRCGRAHDPQAAALAELNRRLAGLDELERRLAGLDEQTRALVADQSRIDAERARLQAEAEALRAALRRQLAIEAGLVPPAPRTSDESIPSDQTVRPARAEATVSAAAATPQASAETSAGPGTSPGTDTPDGPPADAPAPEPRAPEAEAPRTSTPEPETSEPNPPGADRTTGPRATTGGVPRQRTRPDPTIETSRGSARNTLLTLGGVLLALAAVVVTGLFFTAAPTGGRAAILAVATLIALSVPLLLARRTLTATAETLAGFGLLMVLLDGYVAYSTNLLGLGSVSLTLYSSVLCGVVAAVAAGYRLASHLRAPQYAALLAVQPVLPLFAAHLSASREGMAAVFAVVAALNLGSVEVLGRDPGRVLAAVLRRLAPASRSRPLALPGLAPGPDGQVWPRRLRETAWALFGATLATSVGLGVIGLVTARTDAEASRSALVLILAAAVGVAGGLLARRPPLGQVAGGAATFLTVMAANRVNALAVPEHALVLTAGIAVVIALGCRALPRRARPGPRWGSLAGAGFTGIIVAIEVVRTTVAIVRASVTPRVWAADVSAFGERVPAVAAQIPATAVLLVLLAVAAVPRRWRGDAFIAGLGVLALALPPWLFGSASLAWLLVPVVAWAVSSLAVASAVPARRGASAAIRAGTAGVLCLFAVAVGLAGPALTALTCALVAIIAVGTAVGVGLGRGQLGPYAERVADAALGAGAGALPVAVGTATWLVGAPGSVLVPVTLLATAAGVEAAMLAQAAAVARARQTSLVDGQARSAGASGGGVTSPEAGRGGATPPATLPTSRYRSGSAAGALGAATGALLLALRVEGATPADIAVAGLLAAAAVVAVSGRPSVDSLPRDRRGRPTSPWRDSAALAAALATAGLVLAVARLGAVILPGGGLVLTTAAVLAAGLGVVALPRAWRPGPRLGTAAAGTGVVAVTAAIAVVEAANAVAASIPWWHADLASWPQRAASIAPYGAAVPVSLLLAGLAALVLLPRPANIDTFLILASLATLAVPAIVSSPWWSAPVIAGTLTAVAGLTAALVRRNDPPGAAWRRLALAGGLGLYAVAVGSATPAGSGAVLTALLGTGTVVAAVAATRPWVPTPVPGLAAAGALAAAPAAAACVAATFGTGRAATLGIALGACALAVVAVVGLRLAEASWDGYPGIGVGVAALTIAVAAAVSDLAAGATIVGARPTDAPVWAAACALLATVGAGHSRPMPASWRAAAPRMFGSRREPAAFDTDDDDEPRRPPAMVATLAATAVPLGVFAAALSTPAWVTALVGPFQTLDRVWSGYAALPEARGAATALGTLLLLAPTSGGIAVILGGRRYVLAALLPPLAAAAVVLPGALGASPRAVPWVALAVALAAGLGAALTRPSLPVAATWLRATAGVVCALTGAAGLAGSLTTRANTLAALGVLAAGGLAAALLGRDPLVRAVAWVVAGACGLTLPVTAAAAAGTALRSAVFGMLTACAVLVLLAWGLARRERCGDAAVAETIATFGALTAVALAYGSVRHLAAVLTICGVLLGLAALRTDREPDRRMWLVRMAIVTELFGCWLLLYGAHVGFAEAYTLPFAAAALLAGVIEQRRRPHLSSWIVYGPALAGAFLPSVALILVGEDPPWRWVSVFLGAVAIVIVGSWRGWRAPVVTGATIAVGVAIVEMVWLLIEGQIAGAFLVGLAGVTLIVFGAFAERGLRRAR